MSLERKYCREAVLVLHCCCRPYLPEMPALGMWSQGLSGFAMFRGENEGQRFTERKRTMKQPGKCVHFNGTMNECCNAGVSYKSVRKEGEPQGQYQHRASLPCLDKYNLHGATCDKRKLPTPDEVAADAKQAAESFERAMTARKAIVEHAGPHQNGVGKSGVIECPNCKGQLHYSRAGRNGHVMAKCETDGCVVWME